MCVEQAGYAKRDTLPENVGVCVGGHRTTNTTVRQRMLLGMVVLCDMPIGSRCQRDHKVTLPTRTGCSPRGWSSACRSAPYRGAARRARGSWGSAARPQRSPSPEAQRRRHSAKVRSAQVVKKWAVTRCGLDAKVEAEGCVPCPPPPPPPPARLNQQIKQDGDTSYLEHPEVSDNARLEQHAQDLRNGDGGGVAGERAPGMVSGPKCNIVIVSTCDRRRGPH